MYTKILFGRPEGERHKCIWEDDSKMDSSKFDRRGQRHQT